MLKVEFMIQSRRINHLNDVKYRIRLGEDVTAEEITGALAVEKEKKRLAEEAERKRLEREAKGAKKIPDSGEFFSLPSLVDFIWEATFELTLYLTVWINLVDESWLVGTTFSDSTGSSSKSRSRKKK